MGYPCVVFVSDYANNYKTYLYTTKAQAILLELFYFDTLYNKIRAESQIRTDVSLRIMITSQAESTTVPFRQFVEEWIKEKNMLIS